MLHVAAPHLPYQTEILMDTGHGKRCAWIDLREQAGVETMTALLRDADIFTQGYRPGTLAARGFSPGAWPSSDRASSASASAPMVTPARGPTAAASIDRAERHRPVGDARLARQPRNLPVQALDYIAGFLGALGAMIGWRRVEQGGSWLVRVSLVQVAHWLASLGTVDAGNGRYGELGEAELARFLVESDSPFGRLRHLKPVVQLSETRPFYPPAGTARKLARPLGLG